MLRILAFVDKCSTRLQGFGGCYDCADEVDAISRLGAFERPIIFDVGANVGNWSEAALKKWPGASIYMFEPSTTNHERLQSRFPQQHVVNAAVSEEVGKLTLFSDRDGSGLASLHQRRLDHHGLKHEAVETVETITVDSFCALNKIDKIDILKLDIEGHELTALRGARSMLSRTTVVQFEFGGTCIDSRVFFQDYWYLLKEHGFDIYRISPLGLIEISEYSEKSEIFLTCNYIACRAG